MRKCLLLRRTGNDCGSRSLFRSAVFGALVLNASLVYRTVATAEEPAELTAEQRAAHLDRMRAIAKSVKVFDVADENRTPVQIVDEPVLRYTDNTRKLYDSTIWIWGNSGRPSAIMAIEYYPERPREPKWLFEIASLSAGTIAAERGKELRWTAREPGLHLAPLADPSSPDDKPNVRLAQMKKLQQRFGAYERAPIGDRIELRPLARALHRYRDESAGALDGAVFAFANGTNPEILWIIEAREDEKAGSHWQFGLVQMTGAEVFVQLDGKEIWKQGEADPPTERDSYVNGWLAPAADTK